MTVLPPKDLPTKIAIVGAGFAGTEAAKVLARAKNVEVLLIDRNADMAFIPMLYQVATALLRPEQIAYPIRHRFRRWPQITSIQAEVERIDFDRRILQAQDPAQPKTQGATQAATPLQLDYDYLILATGSQSQFLGVPGASSYSFPMRTLQEAVELRDRLLDNIPSISDRLRNPSSDLALTFVIVGGGPTGVELAGGLQRLLVRRGYRLGQTARVVVIQSGDRLFKSYPSRLGRYAARWLRRQGIEVHLGPKVSQVLPDRIVLDDGSAIETQTVIWTAGLEANRPESPQALETAGKGKLRVGRSLQLSPYPEVYGVGDLSHVQSLEQELTGVAQEAMQQGRTAAQNILRQRSGQRPEPFQYRDKGRLAIIGRYAGIGWIKGIALGGPLSGPIAWLLWLEVHWFYLPGWRNRLSVLWTWFCTPPWPPLTPSDASNMSIQKYFPLVGRTFLASIFIYAGLNNLLNFSSTAQRIGGLLPLPELALAGNILCCLLGSLSLVLGFKVRWGTVLLIIFLVPTNLIFHPFWSDGGETIAFLKNLSLIGALLYVNYYGAGPVSLDRP